MIKNLIFFLLRIALLPLVLITSPIFYLVSKTGIGVSICRKFGFHPILLHYYQPIPQYEEIPNSYFSSEQSFPGFQIDLPQIQSLLEKLAFYQEECTWTEKPSKLDAYYSENNSFGYSSAAILHSMIRCYKSRKIIEVGSGFSSLIAFNALQKNYNDSDHNFELVCIEPFPSDKIVKLSKKYSGQVKLLSKKAETLDVSVFFDLQENDILFIDSSHVAKLNSDVNFLYLQVLPLLAKGVIVHIHDIYIPYEYPENHFYGQKKIFWNEQYMLQAFLTNNNQFKIIFPGYYVQANMPKNFESAFPNYKSKKHRKTSSFWIKKVA